RGARSCPGRGALGGRARLGAAGARKDGPRRETCCVSPADPALESFLAVSRARLAPRTVESYRRDLEDFAGVLGRPIAEATSEEIESYLAGLRAAGRASSTVARRLAALRSFFRHQTLVGARDDNPAAGIASPRRSRKLPRTLSAGEAERL